MASLPFRKQGFQKDNLPCIIMSICDLGQALVMHECHYRHTHDPHAAHWTPFSDRHNQLYCWLFIALINSTWIALSWYLYSRAPRAITPDPLQGRLYGPHMCWNWQKLQKEPLNTALHACAQTNYQWNASDAECRRSRACWLFTSVCVCERRRGWG